jgi:hypothetical protein
MSLAIGPRTAQKGRLQELKGHMETHLWARPHPLASTVEAQATGRGTVLTRTKQVRSPTSSLLLDTRLYVPSCNSFNTPLPRYVAYRRPRSGMKDVGGLDVARVLLARI